MSKDIYMGCDIGTGSCKIIAYTADGNFVAQSQAFYSVQHPQPDFAEEDPMVIRKAFVDCLHEILPQLPQPPSGLGFSSCMHSLILVDEDNHPLTSMPTWEDNRSYEIAKGLRAGPLGKQLYRQTGTPIHSMTPLCKIAWFREHEKELFEKTHKFIGIKEFLWHWMFGTFEVDHSIASATGLFNLTELDWDEDALNFCGIDSSKLATPVKTTFVRNDATESFLSTTGLPSGMAFCIGASDGCMANAGSKIDSPQEAALTIGTSGAVRITTSEPLFDMDTMLFNYILDEGKYVLGGPVNNGGNVQQFLLKKILGIASPTDRDYDDLDNMISKIPPGCDGVVCVPSFYGERAPFWNEKAMGIWYGVTNDHNRYHLSRAALEGVCFTMKMILNSIESLSGKIENIYASGGFIHSNSWVQMMADITSRRILIADGPDASAMGALMWVHKSVTGADLPSTNREITEILPNHKNQDVYQRNFETFAKLSRMEKE